jgi:hypothetical protein
MLDGIHRFRPGDVNNVMANFRNSNHWGFAMSGQS